MSTLEEFLPTGADLQRLSPRALLVLLGRTVGRLQHGKSIGAKMVESALAGDIAYRELSEIGDLARFDAQWQAGKAEDGWWAKPVLQLVGAWTALGQNSRERANSQAADGFRQVVDAAMNSSATSTSGFEDQAFHALHIRQDFELLSVLTAEESAIEPALFGPKGAPRTVTKALDVSWGWRKSKEGRAQPDQALVIEMEFPEGTSQEEIDSAMKELADIADDVNRAYGGNGLQVRDFEMKRAPTREGVAA